MTIVRRFLSFVAALARELSDETAYARHLQLSGRAPSAAEWKRFSDHRHRQKYQNGKCC
jgi:hypothetical protein